MARGFAYSMTSCVKKWFIHKFVMTCDFRCSSILQRLYRSLLGYRLSYLGFRLLGELPFDLSCQLFCRFCLLDGELFIL